MMLSILMFRQDEIFTGTSVSVLVRCLTFSSPGKIFSRRHIKTFSYVSQKTGFDISCKLSPMKTVCMKCRIMFSVKCKKHITNVSSAELAQK